MSGVDGLEYTKTWLKRNYQALDLSIETNTQNIINKVLISSYLELLLWDKSCQEEYPETLLIDVSRFEQLKEQVQKLTIAGSILLITNATVGTAIHGLQEFRDTLRSHILCLLEDIKIEQDNQEENMKNFLSNASTQVIDEVKKSLDKRGFPPLDQSKESSLETQIADIASANNRVRKVVQRRIIEFVEGILSSPTAAPMQIPQGLSALQNELSSLAGQFIRLVAHNRAVFSDYYADIITKLLPDTFVASNGVASQVKSPN